MSDKVKEELNKLAKEKVTKEEVVAVLKTEKGLEKLTTEDLTKVEFKDNKLTIEANKDSKTSFRHSCIWCPSATS
nr:hypothetical protein [Mycoplasmopsis bovis]